MFVLISVPHVAYTLRELKRRHVCTDLCTPRRVYPARIEKVMKKSAYAVHHGTYTLRIEKANVALYICSWVNDATHPPSSPRLTRH